MPLPKLNRMPIEKMELHPSFGQVFNTTYMPDSVKNIEKDIIYTWYEVQHQKQNIGVYITAEVRAGKDAIAVRSYPIFLQ